MGEKCGEIAEVGADGVLREIALQAQVFLIMDEQLFEFEHP